MDTILYIHGKGGSAAESEQYKTLFLDCDVIGLDYKTFSPWDTGKEINDAVKELKSRCGSITLIANSIGAYLSMASLHDKKISQAFFISPIVDREKLITDMMAWENITEQ